MLQGDDYNHIMVEALADRLAEAFAEKLHQIVRKELWGYAPDEDFSTEDLLKVKYQGGSATHLHMVAWPLLTRSTLLFYPSSCSRCISDTVVPKCHMMLPQGGFSLAEIC